MHVLKDTAKIEIVMSSSKCDVYDGEVGSIALKKACNIGDETGVVQEGAELRSVQMRNRLPELLRPPTGISKLQLASPQRNASISRGRSNASLGMKQEWDEVVVPLSWDVKTDDLEMIPDDFPLEKTHRFICGVGAQSVASRISVTLRALSVEASYKSKPPKAKCKTQTFVSFRIRLYAGSESGDPVVVEVQRRSGSAASFMRVCRAILDASEGKVIDQSRSSLPFTSKPISEMKCLQGVMEREVDEKQTAEAALQNAIAMLRSKLRDTNLLGLENLCSLTDPFKTNPSVCLAVSKAIALGSGNDTREEIMVLIERDVFSSDIAEDAALSNHTELLRQCALTVFANSLSLCAKDGCLGDLFEGQRWFRDYLIPTLLDEIRRAETDRKSVV